jgi:hypothetical protein
MSMGGWNHRGAVVTARVVVPEGWQCPLERQQAKFRAQMEANRLAREAKTVQLPTKPAA